MPITRSAAKQSHIENFTGAAARETTSTSAKKQGRLSKSSSAGGPPTESSPVKESLTSKKRKASPTKTEESTPHVKKGKKRPQESRQAHFDSDSIEELNRPILVYRLPVLQLWLACVTQMLHPDLSWPTCLSAGHAISSLSALWKGRSIGMVGMKKHADDVANSIKDKNKSEAKKEADRVVTVMSFPLLINLRDNVVVVGGDKKTLPESYLMRKFGEQNYQDAKKVMEECLKCWEGKEEELQKKAFGMYKKFQPNTVGGLKVGFKKGELNLEVVRAVVKE